MILRKDIFSSSIVIKKLKQCYQEVQALPLESLALSSGSCRPIIQNLKPCDKEVLSPIIRKFEALSSISLSFII